MTPKVSIIMGSTSDLKIMEEAAKFFDEMEIPYEINALSAHRVPELVMDFAKNAHKRGIKVVIAGAGGAAHLPGVIAALIKVRWTITPDWGDSTIEFYTRDWVHNSIPEIVL